MIQNYLSFYIVIELLALLAAVMWCRKKNSAYLWLFIPFLLLTCLVEMRGHYEGLILRRPTYYLYTIYIPLSFLFYSFLLLKWTLHKTSRRIIIALMCAGTFFSIINSIWIQGFFSFNSYSRTVLSILLIAICFIYLFNLLEQAETVTNPLHLPMFWIITGLLFFNFGGLVMNILYEFARDHDFTIEGKRMFDVIFRSLNVLLYGSFIIAFRLCYRKVRFIS